MKNILSIILLMINSLASSHGDSANKYSISLWDYNYSMAYTMYYHIDNKSLIIKNISGINNEKDTILVERKLNENERNLFFAFFDSFDIDTLKNEYTNPLVEDGNRKKITIQLNQKTKTIGIANSYQKDLDSLVNLMNRLIPANLRITSIK